MAAFAELVKSPEYIHTYRVTPLPLWNAAALDIPLSDIVSGLKRFSRYDPPKNVVADFRQRKETSGYFEDRFKCRNDFGHILRPHGADQPGELVPES